MVYVLDKFGNPLMPTSDHRKVRLMLKAGAATVAKRTPFTIQLTRKQQALSIRSSLEWMLEARPSACQHRQRKRNCLRQRSCHATM